MKMGLFTGEQSAIFH